MNGDRLAELLDGIDDMALRAEVAQFAAMPSDEQSVHLYLATRTPRGMKAHFANASFTATGLTILAYKIFLGGTWPL